MASAAQAHNASIVTSQLTSTSSPNSVESHRKSRGMSPMSGRDTWFTLCPLAEAEEEAESSISARNMEAGSATTQRNERSACAGGGASIATATTCFPTNATSTSLCPSPDLQQHLSRKHFENLSPSWRMFLLGDGSPTRHLHILTGHKTSVELIDMSPIGDRTARADGLQTLSQRR